MVRKSRVETARTVLRGFRYTWHMAFEHLTDGRSEGWDCSRSGVTPALCRAAAAISRRSEPCEPHRNMVDDSTEPQRALRLRPAGLRLCAVFVERKFRADGSGRLPTLIPRWRDGESERPFARACLPGDAPSVVFVRWVGAMAFQKLSSHGAQSAAVDEVGVWPAPDGDWHADVEDGA